MDHVRGAPFHPQTQGKIERWHQTMKNRLLLENYYLPDDLERQIGAFVDYYTTERYHESLGNVTPAVCLLRQRQSNHQRKGKDQETDNPKPLLATSNTSSIIKPKSDQSLHASSNSRVPNYLTMDTIPSEKTLPCFALYSFYQLL